MGMIVDSNEHAVTLQHPAVTPDDALVVLPRRHVRSLGLLPDAEYRSVWELCARAPDADDAWALSGAMSMTNVADAATLTTDHAHIVVVPRHYK